MATSNDLNISQAGVVSFDGTAVFTGSPLTQHDVLVGGTSNAITNVSPSTAGFVLTSNGISADPSFQDVSASGALKTLTGDSGGAVSPTAGNINILGGTTGLTFSGTSSTLTLNSPELNLPDTTTSAIGLININGNRFLHKYGDANNVFVGTNAGNFTNSGALSNTGVGSSALSALTSGDDNTAIGYNALNAKTTGSRNVSIGSGSLKINTASTDMVAIGYNAFTSSGAGSSRSIAIGSNCCSNFTTGADNTFIGTNSGGGGVGTGSQNTSIGSGSCNIITSGGDNTTVGFNTAISLTTGSSNIALGTNSLVLLTTGIFNTCLGVLSGQNYTGAESSNILINNNGVIGESNVCRIGVSTSSGNRGLTKTYISGIASTTLTAGSPTPYLVLQDVSDDQLSCPTPVQASSATSTYGQLAVGTALRNTSNYPILVNVSMEVTSSVTATIEVGVGSTNTPTAQTVVPSFTVAASTFFGFSFVVPAKFYAKVTTTGTIVVNTITTVATQIG